MAFFEADTDSTAKIAMQDSLGNVISSTYVKDISASGNKFTITKGDGTTSTFKTAGGGTVEVVSAENDGLMIAADKVKLDGIEHEANKTIVDNFLSSESENPVQNKIIQEALDNKSNADHTHDLSELINVLDSSTAVPEDDDYFISQEVGGGKDKSKYYRRPFSTLWSNIKRKLAAVATSGSYSDLSDQPTIGDGTILFYQADSVTGDPISKAAFTVNQTGETKVYLNDTDTRYELADASTLGLTKLYGSTGTSIDGTLTQEAITTQLATKSDTTHTHDERYLSLANGGEVQENVIFNKDISCVNMTGSVITAVDHFDGNLQGSATTATTLTTARKIQTNLASSASAAFDGSANVTPGVTGVLPVAHGGTGGSEAAVARKNLAVAPTYMDGEPTANTYNGMIWIGTT